jgi:hypothetical protein
MNPNDPIDSLDYFVGKICTVHTGPTNWKYQPQENLDYFMGLVNSVGDIGLCLTNVITHGKTFIFTKDIIAISEEAVYDEGDPKYEAAIKDYEEKKTKLLKNNPKLVTPEPQGKASQPRPKAEIKPIPSPPPPPVPGAQNIGLDELYDISNSIQAKK